jgi:hypothetical protein
LYYWLAPLRFKKCDEEESRSEGRKSLICRNMIVDFLAATKRCLSILFVFLDGRVSLLGAKILKALLYSLG